MNLGRAGQRLFQFFQGEGRTPGDFKDWHLTPAAELGRVRDLGSDIEWNHHGTVAIGVNQISRAHQHSGHANFAAEADRTVPCLAARSY